MPLAFPVPSGRDEIEERFGVLEFGPDGRLSKKWESEHLKSVVLPYEMTYGLPGHAVKITKIYCHKLLALTFQHVFEEILRKGLSRSADDYGGCFNVRPQRGTSSKLSTHSWGIAIDINPTANPLGSRSSQHPEVVKIFQSHGFKWGNEFTRPDPMHFQYAYNY